MNKINLLEQETIDKIAAGEVIERPASIVKELVENAIDAGSNAVTVEIKEGGISFIRITDNGEGIPKEQVPIAFLRHATSKIRTVEDLLQIGSLGFRGEALSSIAAVCQVELITKTTGSLTGIRYIIEGGKEKGLEEIGAPEGSTFLVRNVFFNTPARRKFLKSAATEAGYINDLMERMALSCPNISFKFINNGQTRLHTSGNGNLLDIIYSIYGRDISSNLIKIDLEEHEIKLSGFIGKPVVSRGNRNFENYYINGRYVKSSIIAKGIEEGYKTFMMQHRYPFTVLKFEMDGELLDVNVHPTKMELRFADNAAVYQLVYDAVRNALTHRDLILKTGIDSKGDKSSTADQTTAKAEQPARVSYPEPFEKIRRNLLAEAKSPYEPKYPHEVRYPKKPGVLKPVSDFLPQQPDADRGSVLSTDRPITQKPPTSPMQKVVLDTPDTLEMLKAAAILDGTMQRKVPAVSEVLLKQEVSAASETPTMSEAALKQEVSATPEIPVKSDAALKRGVTEISASTEVQPETAVQSAPAQLNLFEDKLLDVKSVPQHKLIGQVFDTYWIVQFKDNLYIIDQHAAHEKVMYERLTSSLKTKEFTSQMISPPIILSLSLQEEELLKKYMHVFQEVGFEIDHFGGKDYSICAVPDNLFGFTEKDLFITMLDSLSDTTGKPSADILNEKLASMACKSAVKGNTRLSAQEADALIKELLELENPYNCPHGRPTIISMSKYELEKKFKRIV